MSRTPYYFSVTAVPGGKVIRMEPAVGESACFFQRTGDPNPGVSLDVRERISLEQGRHGLPGLVGGVAYFSMQLPGMAASIVGCNLNRTLDDAATKFRDALRPYMDQVAAGAVGPYPDTAMPNDAGLRAFLAHPGGRADIVRRVRLVGVKHIGNCVFAAIIDVMI